MATSELESRYYPCSLLRDSEIPSVVWFEDALAYYGVKTIVFDLYLLVPDINTAAHVLIKNGWTHVLQEHGRIGNATVDQIQCRLTPPHQDNEIEQSNIPSAPSHPPGLATTVLLSATDWNFDLEGYSKDSEESLSVKIYPPLAGLLDGLIDSVLDSHSNESLEHHLALQICYLYSYAPELQKSMFAECLIYEHRQYHFDVLSGMAYGTAPFISHQRNIRESLRQGTRELQECSERDNKALYRNRELEAQLLASMPDPFAGAKKD